MDPTSRLDADLENLQRSLHQIDDDKITAIQDKRNRRRTAKHLDGEFNISRLLQAQRENRVATDAPFEQQVSDFLTEQIGVPPQPGFNYVPVGRRDLTADSAPGSGAELAGVDLQAAQFIQYYDQFLDLAKLGVQRFVFHRASTIPGVAGPVTSYWQDGNGAVITESTMTFHQKAPEPKTIGAVAQVSRQLLLQSHPSLQARVWSAMAQAVAQAVSRAIVDGTGLNGRPTGLYHTAGVGTVSGGSLNYGKVLDLIQSVENANALLSMPSSLFIMTPDMARMSRERVKFTSTNSPLLDGSVMAGHGALITKAASPNSVSFGDFSSLALCEFSRLQVAVDPYGVSGSNQFRSALVNVRVLWDVDLLFLNPAAFAYTGVLS